MWLHRDSLDSDGDGKLTPMEFEKLVAALHQAPPRKVKRVDKGERRAKGSHRNHDVVGDTRISGVATAQESTLLDHGP